VNLYHEVYELTHHYVKKGGKKNRNQQRKRMLAFAKFAQSHGVKSLGQLGRKHVIQYWKENRALSERTLYSHWLAIRELWRLSGKVGEPAPPKKVASSCLEPEDILFVDLSKI
jgi:hypothetical protein